MSTRAGRSGTPEFPERVSLFRALLQALMEEGGEGCWAHFEVSPGFSLRSMLRGSNEAWVQVARGERELQLNVALRESVTDPTACLRGLGLDVSGAWTLHDWTAGSPSAVYLVPPADIEQLPAWLDAYFRLVHQVDANTAIKGRIEG